PPSRRALREPARARESERRNRQTRAARGAALAAAERGARRRETRLRHAAAPVDPRTAASRRARRDRDDADGLARQDGPAGAARRAPRWGPRPCAALVERARPGTLAP